MRSSCPLSSLSGHSGRRSKSARFSIASDGSPGRFSFSTIDSADIVRTGTSLDCSGAWKPLRLGGPSAPSKHSSTTMVGEAYVHVQGESLKAYAALLLPDHQAGGRAMATILKILAIVAIVVFAAWYQKPKRQPTSGNSNKRNWRPRPWHRHRQTGSEIVIRMPRFNSGLNEWTHSLVLSTSRISRWGVRSQNLRMGRGSLISL
jgi:hypothetical protein